MRWLGWIRTSVVQMGVWGDVWDEGNAMQASRIRGSRLSVDDELYELVRLSEGTVV